MWITILVMAIAVSLEPFRIGMTVLMLNRPRPMLQLLAFLSGGFAMGMTVGLVVLFVLRRRLAASSDLTLPRVQLLIGGLAVVVGAALAIKVAADRFTRTRQQESLDIGRAAGLGKLRMWLLQLLNGGPLWMAVVVGLGIALPSVDYLAALAVILASRAAAMTQGAALLVYNVAAFTFVEIALVAYLLAPEATRRTMTALNAWIRSRRRLEVAILLLTVGGILLGIGLVGN
jgi:Sap-like sulfolipid-1-addressing protein